MRSYANKDSPYFRAVSKATCLILTISGLTACVSPNQEETDINKSTKGDVATLTSSSSGNLPDSSADPTLPAGGGSVSSGPVCTVDRFKQDDQDEFLRKLDILFVMDHSGSMLENWERVVGNLREFVKEIPAEVDVRYGVILGDVGTYSGVLYSSNNMKVLSNQSLSTDQIGAALFNTFAAAMKVSDPGSGEATFYSLQKAVTTKLKQNQDQGFFRADAALAVVLVSDEQEIGFPFPKVQAPGLPSRCDTAFEDDIKRRYYDANGITVDTAYAAVKKAKGDMPFGTHALVNLTADDLFADKSRKSSCLYESLGYGFFEMVGKTGGQLLSIQSDFAKSLAKIGAAIRRDLTVNHDFKLSKSSDKIDPMSIQAKVDARVVAHRYEAAVANVHLDDAGRPGSSIEISHCEPVVVVAQPTPPTQPTVPTTPTTPPTQSPPDVPTVPTTPTQPAPLAWEVVGFDGTTSDSQANMIWQTQEVPTNAVLEVGLSADNLTHRRTVIKDMKAVHYVVEQNLEPNRRYYFRVIAQDSKGRSITSNVISKQTKE